MELAILVFFQTFRKFLTIKCNFVLKESTDATREATHHKRYCQKI